MSDLPFDPAAIAAVIFDMDGLMLDSERLAVRLIADTAAALGLPWRDEVGLAMIGLGRADAEAAIRRLLGEDFPVDRLGDAWRIRYEAHIDAEAIPHKPGLGELLDTLDRLALPRAVATSTIRRRAEKKLARAELSHRVHALVGGDEVTRGKPAPDIFLAAAAALGVRPEVCLVLEDSNAGVRGALAAGMAVLMIPDLLEPAADVLARGVPRRASLAEVAALFGGERR